MKYGSAALGVSLVTSTVVYSCGLDYCFTYISILLNYFRSNTECTSTSESGFVRHLCDLVVALMENFCGRKMMERKGC